MAMTLYCMYNSKKLLFRSESMNYSIDKHCVRNLILPYVYSTVYLKQYDKSPEMTYYIT